MTKTAATPGPPAPAVILVVDDSPDALELMKRNLGPAGHTVVAAASAEEASELLKGTAFDLVVTDMKMPRVTGLDLIRHVRSHYKGVGVLMVTGYPSIGGAVEALRLGAEDYLAKPFTKQELLDAVAAGAGQTAPASCRPPRRPPPGSSAHPVPCRRSSTPWTRRPP